MLAGGSERCIRAALRFRAGGTGSWTPRVRSQKCCAGSCSGRESPSKPERRAEQHGKANFPSRFGRFRFDADRSIRRIVTRYASGGRGRAPPGRGEGCRVQRGGLLPALRAVADCPDIALEPIRRTANSGPLTSRRSATAKPLQGIPVPLPRRRDEIPRKLPSMVPTRLPRRKRKPVNLPRSRRGMHTNRKMSHLIQQFYSNQPKNRNNDETGRSKHPATTGSSLAPQEQARHAGFRSQERSDALEFFNHRGDFGNG